MSQRFVTCAHCRLPHEEGSARCPFTGAPLDPGAPFVAPPEGEHAGRTLGGRYALRERIGEGGMGAVYVALDTALGREVAVKLLLGREALSASRFAREARAAAAVRHEHVITLHDAGALDDGTPFLVMERLEGESLDRRIAAGPVELADALAIASQLLAGLEAVHRAGIVHRDVKPANVFLVRGEGLHVKLLDFSVAKIADASRLTRSGEVVGTPRYLSPEQARGAPFGPQADVWSVGVVLYELLTGRRPFEADTLAALVTSILLDEPAPPSTHRPELPPAVDRVLALALAKDPPDRYESAAAMRMALAKIARYAGADTVTDAVSSGAATLPRWIEPTTLVDDAPPDPGDA